MPRIIYIATACILAAVLGFAIGFPRGRDVLQEKYDEDMARLNQELENARKSLTEKETETNNIRIERDKYKEQVETNGGVVEFADIIWEESLADAYEKAENEKRWLGVYVGSPG